MEALAGAGPPRTRPLLPPLGYYGGKRLLARDICKALCMSPNWDLRGSYIEPFFGAGSVFFAKEPQKNETISDLNGDLMAFYRALKDPASFKRLFALIDGTLYARAEHMRASRILRGEEEADGVTRAWAVFVALNQSFYGGWNTGWLFSPKPWEQKPLAFQRKKERLAEGLCLRLQNVAIECRDALSVIASCDSPESLFYLDPPYAGSHQKYAGRRYGDGDLAELLGLLKGLKGRFVLSSFPRPLIDEAAGEQGWAVLRKRCRYRVVTADPAKEAGKVELLVANYPLALEGWEEALCS